MEVLNVLPASVSDRGSAICRLSFHYFCIGDEPVKIDDLIVVHSSDQPDRCYLCSSWPLEGSFGAVSESTISFDRFVSFSVLRESGERCTGGSLFEEGVKAMIYYGSSLSVIFPGIRVPAKIPAAIEVFFRFVSDAKRNARGKTKRLQIRALLNRSYVVCGCRISYDQSKAADLFSGLEIVKVYGGDIHEPTCSERGFSLARIGPETKLEYFSWGEDIRRSFGRRINSNSTALGGDIADNFTIRDQKKNSNQEINSIGVPEGWEPEGRRLGDGVDLRGDGGGGRRGLCSSLDLDNFRSNNIGGSIEPLRKLVEIIELPLRFPGAFERLGLSCPRGVLLYGPSGVGKSLVVREVSALLDVVVIEVSAREVDSSVGSGAESHLWEAFRRAEEVVGRGGCGTRIGACDGVIVFIDEIDTLCGARGSHGTPGRDLTAQLLALMDSTRAIVIGATNRPQALDPALRRPGRFDREIFMDFPRMEDRLDILKKCAQNLNIEGCLEWVASRTSGWSGADMVALVREVFLNALADRKSEEARDEMRIGVENFVVALEKIQPSSRRIWTTEVPRTTWDDVGGLDSVKRKLRALIEWPLLYREKFKRFNVSVPRGILLHGPPGCSKTTLVRAIANSCKAHFFGISSADIHSALVGESERTIRELFGRARAAKPSIIFFDEIDAIVGVRGSDGGSTGVLTQLLVEMDGIESLAQTEPNDMVLVVAATNRLDHVDAALLRPGRFDYVIEVPLPDREGRHEILKIHTRKTPLDERLDLEFISRQTEGFTGADLEHLCRESAMIALNENLNCASVGRSHFDEAMRRVVPRVVHETSWSVDDGS